MDASARPECARRDLEVDMKLRTTNPVVARVADHVRIPGSLLP